MASAHSRYETLRHGPCSGTGRLNPIRRGRLTDRVAEISVNLPSTGNLKQSAETWAKNVSTAAGYLRTMAEDQQTGTSHTAEAIAFINDAVRWDESIGCGGPVSVSNTAGWYTKLFFNPGEVADFDPTVADVHTQPTDEAGNDVGRILHVGTGHARLMVVTVETCTGPRAYAGLATSYGELITEGWKRLNDTEWATQIGGSAFPDVPWMAEVLAE